MYLCSENKGVDQLRGYREADLRLCFRICKKPVFSQRGSYTCTVSGAMKTQDTRDTTYYHPLIYDAPSNPIVIIQYNRG